MAVIDSKKLLPSGNPGGSIAESQKPFLVPVSNIIYKKDVNISQKLLKPADRETQEPGGSLVVVKKKVLKIKDIINSTYLIQQSENNRKRKEKQRQKAEDREKKLETKPGGKVDSNNLSKVSLPGTSILDTIKRFVIFTFAGFLFDKYNQYLPKLLEFGKYIAPVTKFIDAFAKNAIDGVIKFIDFGYQTYDNVRKKIDDIGGKDAVKTFDEFSKNLNLILNGAIAASMLIASTSPGKPGRPGAPGKIPGGKPSTLPKNVKLSSYLERDPQTKLIERRYGNDAARMYEARKAQGASASRAHADVLKRFEKFGEPQRGLAGGTGTGGVFSRGLVKSANRTALKVLGKSGTRIAKGVFGRIPIVGGLIDFAFSLAMGENPGRAAAKAVGSTIGAALGTFIPVPFAGTILGGILGDIVGGAMYDTLVGSNQKPQAKAQGGQVRSRQSGVAPTRRIKTQQAPRPKTYTAPKTQPGRDIGGKLKIEELYGKDEPGKRSALRALTKSSVDLKKMNSMHGVTGGMLGAGIDMALGQKPDKKLSNSLGSMFGSVVAAAVNSELDSSFNDISKAIAMASGGVVPSREIKGGMSIGEKIGKYISNAFAIALESSAAKVLSNLNQELNLEGGSPGGVTGPTGPAGNVPGARIRSGSNAQIEADLLEYFTAIYGKNAAIGIVANIRRESGYRTATPDNSSFEGMVQWSRNDRWPKFVKWAESKGLNPYNRNAQAQYIAIDINNHGIAGDLRSASSPEEAASIFYNKFERGAHSKPVKGNAYNPDNPHENLNKQFITDITGRNPDIGSRANQVVVYPTATTSGYKPPTPGLFNAIEYITGDSTQGSNYDPGGHGGGKYHEHIAFKTIADKERAKSALRAAGFVIGSEYRSDSNTYHGLNLAIDVPFYGQTRRYSDNTAGEQKFSADVRRVLGIGISAQPQPSARRQPPPQPPSRVSASPGTTFSSHGVNFFKGTDGKYYKMGRGGPVEIDKSTYDANKRSTQVSLAPSQQSREIASIQQNPSYSQGGSMIIHDVNNIVMPVMVG
jgi:hypothetical protein